MIHNAFPDGALQHALAVRPGLFQPGPVSLREWQRTPDGVRTVPLSISLPSAMVVSLGLWVCLALTVHALI